MAPTDDHGHDAQSEFSGLLYRILRWFSWTPPTDRRTISEMLQDEFDSQSREFGFEVVDRQDDTMYTYVDWATDKVKVRVMLDQREGVSVAINCPDRPFVCPKYDLDYVMFCGEPGHLRSRLQRVYHPRRPHPLHHQMCHPLGRMQPLPANHQTHIITVLPVIHRIGHLSRMSELTSP